MRGRHKLFGILAASIIAAGVVGTIIPPAERSVTCAEQTNAWWPERRVGRMRRRMKPPERTSRREIGRRLRQITDGALTAANGLAPRVGR